MRDYTNFDGYLDELEDDIYEQPPDQGHTRMATRSIDWAFEKLSFPPESVVLDVGCGQGFCRPLLMAKGFVWNGVTLGRDFEVCREKGLPVYNSDVTFMSIIADDTISVIFARHILEHSPFPLLTLMEWRRVVKPDGKLVLVAPAPEFWKENGKNHYSVFDYNRLWYTLTRAGWWIEREKIVRTRDREFAESYRPEEKDRSKAYYPGASIPVEYWFVCKQGEKRIE